MYSKGRTTDRAQYLHQFIDSVQANWTLAPLPQLSACFANNAPYDLDADIPLSQVACSPTLLQVLACRATVQAAPYTANPARAPRCLNKVGFVELAKGHTTRLHYLHYLHYDRLSILYTITDVWLESSSGSTWAPHLPRQSGGCRSALDATLSSRQILIAEYVPCAATSMHMQ